MLKSASGIEARHCVINLKEGIATLVPQSEDAMCMINAVTVNQPIRLYQGCVIVLGKTNMFRYVSHTFFFITFFFSFSHLNYMNILCTPQSNLLQRCWNGAAVIDFFTRFIKTFQRSLNHKKLHLSYCQNLAQINLSIICLLVFPVSFPKI